MKKSMYLILVLCFCYKACLGQSYYTNDPFRIIYKDINIVVPDTILRDITYSQIVVGLIVDKEGVIKDYRILKFKLNSSSINIDYYNKELYQGQSKAGLKELEKYLPYIEKNIKKIKIGMNKYSKPKNENHGFVTFRIINKNK
jgi:hypothetical protein